MKASHKHKPSKVGLHSVSNRGKAIQPEKRTAMGKGQPAKHAMPVAMPQMAIDPVAQDTAGYQPKDR